MIDPIVLLAFLPAALALNLTPGADMMFCFGQGLRAGPHPAMRSRKNGTQGCMTPLCRCVHMWRKAAHPFAQKLREPAQTLSGVLPVLPRAP